MSGTEPLTILFVSHTDAFGTFRVGSHHLARELSRAGHRVAHVSTPVSLAHRILRRGDATRLAAARAGATTDADGVTHFVGMTLLPAGISKLDYPALAQRLLGVSRVDIVFIDQPLLWSKQLRSIAKTLVYRPTDTYDDGIKARLQHDIVAAADAVVATSPEVLARLSLPSSMPSLVLPNGVEIERFIDEEREREDVAVYVGALDARFDWKAVERAAVAAPDWRFDIYGPTGTVANHLPSNVRVLGPLAYDAIAEVLASAKVGLLPLSDAPENQGRSPMKLYEYLASGLRVVTRETPVLRSDVEHGVYAYSSDGIARSFAEASDATTATNAGGREVAQTQGWGAKATELIAFTGELER